MAYKTYEGCVHVNGAKSWYQNGELHREDGPAVEWDDGDKYWYQNGKYHREDGPAIELANGDKEWWLNGKLHREDGPAIELSNGSKEWWLNGNLHREERHSERMNPAKELTVAEVAQLLGYKVKIVE